MITVPEHDALAKFHGIQDFDDSVARTMLAQYQQIEQLLGDTYDWTHPGNLCESLLREFLRDSLPGKLSVDKGFVYGRTQKEDRHCPEIDILIHNSHEYSPLFRSGDFVLVEPEAVIGVIQVKRSFQGDPLKKGIEQTVAAKKFLLDVKLESRNPKRPPPNQSDLNEIGVFSAVLSFQGATLDGLRNSICGVHKNGSSDYLGGGSRILWF